MYAIRCSNIFACYEKRIVRKIEREKEGLLECISEYKSMHVTISNYQHFYFILLQLFKKSNISCSVFKFKK